MSAGRLVERTIIGVQFLLIITVLFMPDPTAMIAIVLILSFVLGGLVGVAIAVSLP